MEDKFLTQLKERYEELKLHRAAWFDHLSSVQELVLPNSSSFTDSRSFRGEQKQHKIFDGTAPWALEMFAAGLHSYLTSPIERWFQLSPVGEPAHRLSREARLWLEHVSDTIYHYYSLPEANTNSALHEAYLSLGGFGVGALYQYEREDGLIAFRSYNLGDLYFDENHEDRVDVVFRKMPVSTRKLIQMFPYVADHQDVKNAKDMESWEVIHAVLPRKDRNPKGLNVRTNKEFGEYYFCTALDFILDEGGYDDFPYHVPRWTKLAGEIMGRSPAMSVLPDIKMVNAMSKEILYSAQLANMPPLVFDEDSMLLPVKTVTPKSIMFKQQGAEMPQPLTSGSQPQLALEDLEQRRDIIRQAFFVDFLLRPKKKERQTTLEIQDDRAEMLRQMAPMLGRVQDELLGDMIKRTFRILARKNRLPDPPEELSNRPLEIVYTSPAAKAQYGTKAVAISQFLQDLAQIAQFDPSAPQTLDSPELIQELAKLRDVSRRVLKDPATLKKEKEAQAQQEQMAMAAEAGPAAGKTIKDIAQAREADPTLVQQLGM